MRCKLCQNESGNTGYPVREMMFGLRECFTYVQCAACKCLQLEEVPPELSRYYPAQYYSFARNDIPERSRRDIGAVRFLRRARSAYILTGKGGIGRCMAWGNPAAEKLSRYLGFFRRCRARLSSRILDVGCGSGKLAAELAWYGFTSVTGIDPYIPEDTTLPSGVRLYKRDIFAVEGTYDVIMFNHSFEHLDRPVSVLGRAYGLLAEGGWCMIRMPLVSSFAWERFRHNWVQIDAPRHLFLHSTQSLNDLAAHAGFKLAETVFDSTEFQFWGSLQYEQDIPLLDERSYAVHPGKSIFSEAQIADFKSRAVLLNEQKQGDQACFFLQKRGREA